MKPCPFCDSEPTVTQGVNKEKFYKITCSNPNCHVLVYLTDNSKKRLIERWNRRNGYVSEPRWKDKFPSAAGYWWYRESRDTKPDIVELRCDPETMDWYAVFAFTGETKRVKEIDSGQWANIYFPYKEINNLNLRNGNNQKEDRISLSAQLDT